MMIKKFFCPSKIWFPPEAGRRADLFSGSLAIWNVCSGAVRNSAHHPRRRRRRNAFKLFLEYTASWENAHDSLWLQESHMYLNLCIGLMIPKKGLKQEPFSFENCSPLSVGFTQADSERLEQAMNTKIRMRERLPQDRQGALKHLNLLTARHPAVFHSPPLLCPRISFAHPCR